MIQDKLIDLLESKNFHKLLAVRSKTPWRHSALSPSSMTCKSAKNQRQTSQIFFKIVAAGDVAFFLGRATVDGAKTLEQFSSEPKVIPGSWHCAKTAGISDSGMQSVDTGFEKTQQMISNWINYRFWEKNIEILWTPTKSYEKLVRT